MSLLEEHILKPMLEVESDKVILKDNLPISFLKENGLVKEEKIIKSDQIFELLLSVLSTNEVRNLMESRTVKMHYKLNDVYFTLQVVSEGTISCVIQKGKFDLYPHTDVVVPEIKMGHKYTKIENGEVHSWILVGLENDDSIKFLVNENGVYEEKSVLLLEFLKMLRRGLLHKEI